MILNRFGMTGMLLAASAMAHGAEHSKPEVLVRFSGVGVVHPAIMFDAQGVAAEILAAAGVRLRWVFASTRGAQSTTSDCGPGGAVQTIEVRFLRSTPAQRKPAALAEAFLYPESSAHIDIFFDRVAIVLELRKIVSSRRIPGHVLAHEIGHLLLGVAGHSETGLMKAHWDRYDFSVMDTNYMSFTPEDARLIRSNLSRVCAPPMPR